MANRRRRQPALPDRSHRHTANSMDQLAFTYMEMCKVESSTDSDSEISPRWSDTSTMGCVSSAPESGSYRRTLPLPHKPAGRPGCCSLFLDPYDGSSEDSDESNVDVGVSNRPTRQAKGGGGGGCRFLGRSRRFLHHHPASLREAIKSGMRDPVAEQQHLLDVQMKCGSDSELWVCELDVLSSHSDRDGHRDLKKTIPTDSTMHAQAMDVELDCQFDDSGLPDPIFSAIQMPEPETPVEGSSFHMLNSSSERSPSPCDLRSLYKRKLGLLGAEMVELEQRKKQCVVSMEEEQEEGGSASEPCWSHLTTE